MFCKYCGKYITANVQVCPYCQHNLASDIIEEDNSKDWRIVTLLCCFTGGFGIHRFYTGYIGRGILYIFTICGFFGLLPFIDLIQLLRNKYIDASGNSLSHFSNTMRKILLILFLLYVFYTAIMIGFYLYSYNPSVTSHNEQSLHLKSKKLSEESIAFLKKSDYTKYYQDKNKKLVFYIKCDTCPIRKAFADRVDKYASHPAYQKYYNFAYYMTGTSIYFYSNREADNFTKFLDQCDSFCIINTSTNRFVSLESPDQLYDTFNTYKDW